jgi:hypothetical protein
VWSNKKVQEKLDYMHRNPVQRKLVQHPREWPWSSWSHYEKGERGLIRIDALRKEIVSDRQAPAKRRSRSKTAPLKGTRDAAPASPIDHGRRVLHEPSAQ